jgi:hypothetical protein
MGKPSDQEGESHSRSPTAPITSQKYEGEINCTREIGVIRTPLISREAHRHQTLDRSQ